MGHGDFLEEKALIIFFFNYILLWAEEPARELRAQASMMTTVACAVVLKISLLTGVCFGSESYAMVMDVKYFKY